MNGITLLSPAKVNLYLRVLARRPDGYHEIETLFQAISVYDELCFYPIDDDGKIEIICDSAQIPIDETNIVHRAARAIFAKANYRNGIKVEIKKRIPVAAGLGGGSSNAATTLTAINKILSFGLSREELVRLGASLGADVPFFILGQTAWARGIGEKLTKADGIPLFHYLIVNPGFALSTKDVYQGFKFDLTNKVKHYSSPPRFVTIDTASVSLRNDLETVSCRLYPAINDIKQALLLRGARASLMSGSGATTFGIFEDATAMRRAQAELEKAHAEWIVLPAVGVENWAGAQSTVTVK